MVHDSSSSPPHACTKTPSHELQVVLTLHDGERSFGMSLAQKTSSIGAKYTVVSSVFAKSPADRAGVRKGYVVQRINDVPMSGLTVAQVANHFRNQVQARITLEVVEKNEVPLKTAAARFGRTTMLSVSNGKRLRESGHSGTAIAAPGSALTGMKVTTSEQGILRHGTKPDEKSSRLQLQTGVDLFAAANMSSTACNCGNISAAVPSTIVKSDSVSHVGLNSRHVIPVRRSIAQKVDVVTSTAESAAQSVSEKLSNTCSSRIFHNCAKRIKTSSSVDSGQVGKEHEKIVKAAQLHDLASSVVSAASPSAPRAVLKATASTSAMSRSITAKVPITAPRVTSMEGPRFVESTYAAVEMPTGNAMLHPFTVTEPTTSTFADSSSAYRLKTTDAKPQVSAASDVNITNSAKRNSSPELATAARTLQATPTESATQIRHSVEAAPRSVTELAWSATSTPVRSIARTSIIASVSVPVSPVTMLAPLAAAKTGKKRGRQQTAKAANGIISNKGKGKAKKAAKQEQERDEADSIVGEDDVFDCGASTSDSGSDELLSKKFFRRTTNVRRRGATDRTRHSLTIVWLVDMGFKREDAEASVKEIGDDPDACMVWLISKIEERQFNEDLNRASIQSERSKHDEEKRVKKLEREQIAHAEKFMAVFPTSYMVCAESTALHFKALLQSTIDQVHGGSYLRKALSELMRLEGKSIRWYREASRSYMLHLAERLDATLQTHDVTTCCALASANDMNSPNGCKFVHKIVEELNALKMALFGMPTNQGGVPQAFLEYDETTKFNLEDDGFEVIGSSD